MKYIDLRKQCKPIAMYMAIGLQKILKVLNIVEPKMNYLYQIRTPKLSDKELIAIDLTTECMSIDSECQLFRILHESLSSKIERSVYNRRR